MPIYEYQCGKCGERHEVIQKFTESPKRKCPSCGALRLKKLMSAPAFHLKGEGWYVTDFRDKDKGKKAKSDGKADAKSDGKSDGKADAKDKPEKKDASSKNDTKSDSKPASGDTKSQAA